MGGYEGADHINGHGMPLQMGRLTQHDERANSDYAALREFGISCIRESIGWRLVEVQGRFDFSSLQSRLDAARVHGIQIVWTFCHYGWPDDVNVFDDVWIERFERFCTHTMAFLNEDSRREWRHGRRPPPVYTPINEISFLTWAVCETGLIYPSLGNRRGEAAAVKQRLVRGAMAACDVIWKTEPSARILTVDPMVHIIAPASKPELAAQAMALRNFQFQAWDMLAGLSEPHLGGHPKYLDLVGINYYHDNQWEFDTQMRLHWHLGDPRRMPFRDLLAEAHTRYQRPLVVAETSHIGVGRGTWIAEITNEVIAALQKEIPVLGVCLYPLIDRPDWQNLEHWHNSGLWDLHRNGTALERQICVPYALDLKLAQRALDPVLLQLPPPVPSSFFGGSSLPSLVVFCHLRWDFVFQRPQQLMTRLGHNRQIIFVEEPVFDAGPSYMEISSPCANVQVLRAHTSVRAPGFHADQWQTVQVLLDRALRLLCPGTYCAWFYTPLALPLLDGLKPLAVVYDCMDDLSAFALAPPLTQQRDRELLSASDLVFTAGPSLQQQKGSQHPAVHCFPNAVDAAHFAKGRESAHAHPVLLALARPRLGYFGVVDERFDAVLLAAIADARPRWQLCIVGPVVKIDPAALPRRANIHYFGHQPYADLPSFLAGWDVCLIPFALNAATRTISPTKTLEYAAAGLPIVSTPIADVVALYGDLVRFGDGTSAFLQACEGALDESAQERAARCRLMRQRVESLSWDATASELANLLDLAIQKKAGAQMLQNGP